MPVASRDNLIVHDAVAGGGLRPPLPLDRVAKIEVPSTTVLAKIGLAPSRGS